MTPTTTMNGNGGRHLTRRDAKGPLEHALGWLSIGLGVAELAYPRGVARLAGIRDDRRTRGTLLAFGLRELLSGLGILARRRPAGFLWARVVGDAIDLALLGRAFSLRRGHRDRVAVAIGTVGAVALLDTIAGVRLGRRSRALPGGAAKSATRVITINRSPGEVFRFFRDLENLPRFMAHLESVEVLDGSRSRWHARSVAGTTFTWEAEIVDERADELLSWRSLPGSEVANAGTVRFSPAPGGRGTELRVDLRYDAPGGRLGAALAKLTGREPGQQIEGDLRRLKQVIETGEVVHSDASIHAGPHAARPSKSQDRGGSR
jgi:uncharacterized membrane protein